MKNIEMKEKEPRASSDSPVPIQDGGMRRRISSVIDEAGSRTRASEVSGVSSDMLAKYVSGTSRPRFEAIARLCVDTGVSLDWVATGEGARYRQDIDEKGGKFAAACLQDEQKQGYRYTRIAAEDVADEVVNAFLWLKEIAATERLEPPRDALADLLRLAVSLPRIPENATILARVMRQMCR